ncbi:M48 family metalloprotease [Pseudonocardia humida]|uniref:M48 family metalloprotease n=1 Tax=Pseudonocardia humida TaxID=2800819 RepID=A0ABT1AB18_9PSEU|nr:M48 family metalloprotease [Pseudonocardia humida]MCO1659839.1 M48 family metalloprotease [Pseudonocardia humida]
MDAVAAPGRPPPVRPDVLAFPAPTTGRFLVLLVALLAAGLFVGDWLHSEVAGVGWWETYQACAVSQQVPADGPVATGTAGVDVCRAGSEHTRASFVLGGAAAVGLGGVGVLHLAPVLIRRRRRLVPPVPGLRPAGQRFAELSAAAGLARCPTLLLGPARQRDAFSFGAPGRYAVVLPIGLALKWRDPRLFDPVVRHELAHVVHRDVAFAWLARSIWYVLAPALVLPVLAEAASGDLPQVLDYLWRALLLAGTVQLVVAALLRSREHDADLRAARLSGGPEPVLGVVALVRAVELPWYRRPLALHPGPAERRAVLEHPELVARVSFLDGFTAAFLSGLTGPLVVTLVVSGAAGRASNALAQLGVALVVGPLLGASVGLALWRASVVARTTGRPASPWPAALGVAAGLVCGYPTSLGTAATVGFGVEDPLWFPVVAAAGAGATLLVAGAGEVWADAVAALRGPRRAWVPAVVVSGTVFAAVVWALVQFDLVLGGGGWPLVGLWLLAMPDRWLPVAAVLVVVGAVVVALVVSRRDGWAPAWIVERGGPAPWPAAAPRAVVVGGAGVLAGLGGGAVAVVADLLVAPAVTDAQTLHRFFTSFVLAAAVGAAGSAALGVLRPADGPGLGGLVGPLAATTTTTCSLALFLGHGSELDAGIVADALCAALVMGFFATALTAPVAAAVGGLRRRSPGPRGGVLAAVAVGTAVAAGLGVGTVAAATAPPTLSPVQEYVTVVVPDLLGRYEQVEDRARDAVGDGAVVRDPARADRIRYEVLPPLREVLVVAEAHRPATAEIRAAHDRVLRALRAKQVSLEVYAVGYTAADPGAFAAAEGHRAEELRAFQQWATAIAALEE